MITLGSLFDGCGGFPLAANQFNIKTIWSSEIDPACLRVTARHFPEVDQVGDIKKLSGYTLAPVDIITFGSPCQDLSIAGNRAGLAGEKSGLFLEAIRIIREMREATNGKCPRFAIWENVAGAFSSNKGEDFRQVLEAFAGQPVPMPGSGKWAKSGMVRWGSGELAWRLFDAQYWGVPQRRKRIYLVADFGTEPRRAGEILFKPESLPRYFKESGEAREESAGTAGKSINAAIARTLNACKTGTGRLCADVDNFVIARSTGKGFWKEDNVSGTLRSRGDDHQDPAIICQAYGFLGGNSPSAGGIGFDAEVSPTLKASGSGTNQIPDVLYSGTAQSDRIYNPSGVAPTMAFSHETGGPEITKIFTGYRVRRLMPVECERLQGYPDGWTEGESDSARYRMLGNSLALPCPGYILGNIADEMEA